MDWEINAGVQPAEEGARVDVMYADGKVHLNTVIGMTHVKGTGDGSHRGAAEWRRHGKPVNLVGGQSPGEIVKYRLLESS